MTIHLPRFPGDPVLELSSDEVETRFRLLRTFTRELAKGGPPSSESLRAAYRELEAVFSQTGLDPSDAPVPDPVAQESFAEAVFLLGTLGEMGGRPGDVLTTVPCETLQHYRVEVDPPGPPAETIRRILLQVLDISSDSIERIESGIAVANRRVQLHRAIVGALEAHFGLTTGSKLLSQGIRSLFSSLFPALAAVVSKVELIKTPAVVLFAIELPQQSDLIEKFSNFPFDMHRQFPSFNPFAVSRLPDELLADLAGKAGLTLDEYQRHLPRCIALVQIPDLEKLVVHDIWGHYWQGLLTSFSEDFVRLADLAQPLVRRGHTETERFTLRAGDLEKLFHRDERGEWALDTAAANAYFDAEATSRIYYGLVLVISELLADVAESKLHRIDPAIGSKLASSSRLPQLPCKLDLSLGDLDLIVTRALSPLLDFGLVVRKSRAVEADLARLICPDPASAKEDHYLVKKLLMDLKACFWGRFVQEYQPLLRLHAGSGGPKPSTYTRLALNLTHIVATLNSILRAPLPTPAARRPLFPPMAVWDLIMIFIARYTEAERERRFWRLDEDLAKQFLKLWDRLQSIEAG